MFLRSQALGNRFWVLDTWFAAVVCYYLVIFPFLINPLSAQALSEQAVVPQSREQISFSFAPLVEKTAPAVVEIYALQVTDNPFMSDPFWQFFSGSGIPRQQLERSLGSGVIVRSDGIVVTNYHVVKNAREIKVKLNDNREYDAEIVSRDIKNDLVALKLKNVQGDLPSLPLSNFNDQKIGDLVLAIGNSFGLGNTVTDGIISALNRALGDRVLIQISNAINPGNSGGAVVNMKGELVGIANAIISKSGTSSGVGFAVPSSLITAVVAAVGHGGKVVRPWDGITVQSITSDIASSLGLSKPQGVIVKSLHSSSPAKAAGLKRGDVILKVNNYKVMDVGEYEYYISSASVGSPVALDIQRNKETMVIKYTSIAPPEDPPAEKTTLKKGTALAGVAVANASPALASEYGFDPFVTGVIILSIAEGSPLQFLRIQPGDLIEEVNGNKVKTVKDLKKILKKSLKGYSLVFKRGDKRLQVSVR